MSRAGICDASRCSCPRPLLVHSYPSAVADTVVVGEGAGNVYYQREQPKVLNTAPRADFIYRDVLQRFEEIVLSSNSAMSRLVLNHLLKYHRLLKSTIKEAKNALVSQRKRSQQYNGDKINSEHQTSGQILNLAKHRKELELKLKKIETR